MKDKIKEIEMIIDAYPVDYNAIFNLVLESITTGVVVAWLVINDFKVLAIVTVIFFILALITKEKKR